MQKLIKLVSAMALLASLPVSEATAQHQQQYTLSGKAMKQPVQQFLPRFATPSNAGVQIALGNQLLDPDNADKILQREHRTRVRLEPVPTGNLEGDLVSGMPFVVFVGDSASNPILLIDSGIVPDEGLRVIGALPSLPDTDQGRFRDMNVYFRSADTIICVKGRDALQSFDVVALSGPGSIGLQSGQGAHLLAGNQSLTTSAQTAASGDDDDDSDTGRTRERRRDHDAAGTSASVAVQAAP